MTYCAILFDEYIDLYYVYSINICSLYNKCRVYHIYLPLYTNVICYTPEGGKEQSIDTGSDLTHYNLTGLERNRVYTNIAVQAVNIIGRSDRSAVIAQYNHTLPAGE